MKLLLKSYQNPVKLINQMSKHVGEEEDAGEMKSISTAEQIPDT